jgi:mRNA interferase MazF
LKRGDIVSVAAGKPRPSVVVQADDIVTPHEILLCPLTTHLLDAPMYRVQIEPDAGNRLKFVSQIMVDKVGPAPRNRVGGVIGRLAPVDLTNLDASLLIVLDLVSG